MTDQIQARPIGTWELVSLSYRLDGGGIKEPWPNATGRISYDARGNVAALIMSGRRNEAAGTSSPPDSHDEFTSYFGTHEVDETNGMIIHNVTASLSATRASGQLRRTFSIKEGLQVISFPMTWGGVPAINQLVWKLIS